MSGDTSDDCMLRNAENEDVYTSINKEEYTFDEIIGHIEDLLVDDEFHEVQQKFLERYWTVFEPMEENKLIYMDIFNKYNEAIESTIINYLRKVMPCFDMNVFLRHLHEKRSELDGEVFEVLSTFTDFLAFKEMFLDYRAIKEGKVEDLSKGISIASIKLFNTENDNIRR